MGIKKWRDGTLSIDGVETRLPYTMPRIIIRENVCTWGWEATKRSPSCNYTGGHYCDRDKHDKGRCRCGCGATTTRPKNYRELQDDLLRDPIVGWTWEDTAELIENAGILMAATGQPETQWSKEQPTEEGYYWAYIHRQVAMVRVYSGFSRKVPNEEVQLLVEWSGDYHGIELRAVTWWGPKLQPPKPPKEKQ